MFITPSTLAYARARHLDLEREADQERLLRAARAAQRACCGDVADETCCAPGCCDEPGCCVQGPDDCAGSSPRGARDAAGSPAWRRRAGGVAALLLRAVRTLRPAAATRCASAAATRCAPSCAAA
jgi:hypothetical protein